MSGDQANRGQAVNGTVASETCGVSTMSGCGNGDDEDPPEEHSSKLPLRF